MQNLQISRIKHHQLPHNIIFNDSVLHYHIKLPPSCYLSYTRSTRLWRKKRSGDLFVYDFLHRLRRSWTCFSWGYTIARDLYCSLALLPAQASNDGKMKRFWTKEKWSERGKRPTEGEISINAIINTNRDVIQAKNNRCLRSCA